MIAEICGNLGWMWGCFFSWNCWRLMSINFDPHYLIFANVGTFAVYPGFRGWGVPAGFRGDFLHWRNQKIRVFSNSKIFKNVFKKSMKNLQFWENLQIYIHKSQWKTDFLHIFSPIFQDFWLSITFDWRGCWGGLYKSLHCTYLPH